MQDSTVLWLVACYSLLLLGVVGLIIYRVYRRLPVLMSLKPEAFYPRAMTEGAGGYDVASLCAFRLPAGERVKVSTGIQLAIPRGFVGLVFGRSGHGFSGLENPLGVGVLDSDYRDEVLIPLHNNSSEEKKIERGDRIGQLVFVRSESIRLIKRPTLPASTRVGGFGSTSKNTYRVSSVSTLYKTPCLICRRLDTHDRGCALDFSLDAMENNHA